MVQKQLIFTDNCFIMASRMLVEKDRRWVVRDFDNQKISKRLAAEWFNFLIDRDILSRDKPVGPGSSAAVKDREKLLRLCERNFINPERKTLSFICRRDKKALLSDLKESNLDFFLARFSGVAPGLVYVEDESLYLYLTEIKMFKYESVYSLEKKFGIHRVSSGGDIFIMLPRYRKFLKSGAQESEGFKIPGDFYTYLDMMTMDSPRGRDQARHMEKKLRNREGSFF
jgi:hypothetical protein